MPKKNIFELMAGRQERRKDQTDFFGLKKKLKKMALTIALARVQFSVTFLEKSSRRIIRCDFFLFTFQ